MIEAHSLTKRYGEKVAVNDLSFTVKPGKVTGFLGPNGAGKSTTMRMMLGLDRPSSGWVQIDGRHYSELKQPLRAIGALVDAKWIHPNRSAYAHLHWLARSNRIPRKRIKTVLEMVGLEEVANKRAGGFSLGMSQRLGIASALLGDPPIVMFDEPVNGLDPEGIHWIRRFMQGLAREGRTVFVSSHLLSEMALTAEELVVVGKGELISQSTTQEFIEGATTASVKVRSPHAGPLRELLWRHGMAFHPGESESPDTILVDSDETERIGEIAASAGLIVHELTVERGSLEDAFMQLTSQAVEYQTPSNARHSSRSPEKSKSPDDSAVSDTGISSSRRGNSGRSGTAPRITRHGAAPKPASEEPRPTSPGRSSGSLPSPGPGTSTGSRAAPGPTGPGTASRPSMLQPGRRPQPGPPSRPSMPQPGTASWPSLPQPGPPQPGTASRPSMPQPGRPGTPARGAPQPPTGQPPTGRSPQPGTPADGMSERGTAAWPPMPQRDPVSRPDMPPPGPAPSERGTPRPGTSRPGTARPGTPRPGTNGPRSPNPQDLNRQEPDGWDPDRQGPDEPGPRHGQPPGTVRR